MACIPEAMYPKYVVCGRNMKPMVCEATPSGSGHSAEAEALVYNFVKRKKPGLLLEMFGKDRCQELEKRDHLYDRNSLISMLKEVEGRLPVVKEDASQNEEQKNNSNARVKENGRYDISSRDFAPFQTNNEAIPGKNKVRITPELAVFNYFHERQQGEALKLLFNEEKREDYGRKVESMGIWMPPKENRQTQEIWKCELCKKEIKGHGGRTNLLNHLGSHENIPCPCIIEGCDAILRRLPSLLSHLKNKHVLLVASLNAKQYYAVQDITKQFRKKAETFRDKYFPPEAFIGFDRKMQNTAKNLQDSKCKECRENVKSATTRRTHVAGHLKLSYECVFEGCKFKAEPNTLAGHFHNKHSTKVGDLNEEQLFKHKQIKLDFGKIMRKEVPNYFGYKSEVPGELLF
uniref:C2H2-type domain-containing protein n=1 Tax=Steinernema glaseri TaxID=37863 RepID=A0A1I7Z909_9BILA